jgi:hypothetical protein
LNVRKLAAIAVLSISITSLAHAQTALYATSTGTGSLYQINPSNGSGTLVAALHDSANHQFGVQSLATDAAAALWGATSTTGSQRNILM